MGWKGGGWWARWARGGGCEGGVEGDGIASRRILFGVGIPITARANMIIIV